MRPDREVTLLVVAAGLLLVDRALSTWVFSATGPSVAAGAVIPTVVLAAKVASVGVLIPWRAQLPPRPRTAELALLLAFLLPGLADAALTAIRTPDLKFEFNALVQAWLRNGVPLSWARGGVNALIFSGVLTQWLACAGLWRWLASVPNREALLAGLHRISAFRALARTDQARLVFLCLAAPLAVQGVLLNAISALYWTRYGVHTHIWLSNHFGNMVVEHIAALAIGVLVTAATAWYFLHRRPSLAKATPHDIVPT